MAEVKNRKKRGRNFTVEEKLLLLNLVAKYKHIIESKHTNSVIWKQKTEIWKKIERDLNAESPSSVFRDQSVLKSAYDNSKKATKKIAGEESKSLRRTGEGPVKKIKTDATYELTLALLNKKTVYGHENPYDDDALALDTRQPNDDEILSDNNVTTGLTPAELPSYSPNHIAETSDEQVTTENHNWKNYTPALIQTPVNNKLKTAMRENRDKC